MISGPSLLFAKISKPCIRAQSESTTGVFLVPPNLKTEWRLETQSRATELLGRVGPAGPKPTGEVHNLATLLGTILEQNLWLRTTNF